MPDVVMPRLSDSMEEGTVLKWLKAPGEEVRRGEELVEIETDKATMTYESDQDGVLEIVAAEGDTLPIGAVIARVGSVEIGTPPAPPTDGASGNGAAGAAVAAPTTGDATPAGAPVPVPVPDAPAPAPAAGGGGAAAAPAAQRGAPSAGARLKASPVARRIARELGVDLAGLTGSGPGGRIVRSDVEGAAGQGAAAPAPAVPVPSSAPAVAAAPTAGTADIGTAKGEVTLQELTRTQQVVARRMAESRATIPDFTLQAEVDMGACVEMRAALKALEIGVGGPPIVPTYNDMVVKACAIALREYPRANGSYRDGRFELHSRVNVGVAVAAADSLVVPTVFDADTKSLLAVARDTRALAERVREGTVTPPELSGGTFTVSNLGMFGVRSFTAVINPPQAAILSVGSLEERPVVRDGQLVAGHTMSATLACDHRILYGADAARFLARIRRLLEQPLALTLTP